jgi:hypothetical protein
MDKYAPYKRLSVNHRWDFFCYKNFVYYNYNFKVKPKVLHNFGKTSTLDLNVINVF